MTWSPSAAARALRIEGLDLADPEAMPKDLGKGRYEVATVSRMARHPAGARVVVAGREWKVEKGTAQEPERGEGVYSW